MTATPIVSNKQVPYPVSSSPDPLNYIALKLAKVISGPDGLLLGVFSNGEVHEIDLIGARFNLLHRLVSDERAKDVSNPITQFSHAFDHGRNGLWSVISAGMFAYMVFTDFNTKTVGEWQQLSANMKLDPGEGAVETDFSPETFINAVMVDKQDGQQPEVLLQLESLNNVGFDLLTFVNHTSGEFTGPVYNLMNYQLVFKCQSYNCDKDRLSAYDPGSKTVWFQAHIDSQDPDTTGNIAIAGLTFDTTVTGKPTYTVWVAEEDAPFGYTGFQFYSF